MQPKNPKIDHAAVLNSLTYVLSAVAAFGAGAGAPPAPTITTPAPTAAIDPGFLSLSRTQMVSGWFKFHGQKVERRIIRHYIPVDIVL